MPMADLSSITGLPGVGVLLLDSGNRLLGFNDEAIQILSGSVSHADDEADFIEIEQLERILVAAKSGHGHFRSGRRTYGCQSIDVDRGVNGSGPITAILLNRICSTRPRFSQLAERYGLTPREVETVEFLAQGLSSKEIAHGMNISPNTVKAFIRTIMVKMQAPGRTAIVSIAMEHVCDC